MYSRGLPVCCEEMSGYRQVVTPNLPCLKVIDVSSHCLTYENVSGKSNNNFVSNFLLFFLLNIFENNHMFTFL